MYYIDSPARCVLMRSWMFGLQPEVGIKLQITIKLYPCKTKFGYLEITWYKFTTNTVCFTLSQASIILCFHLFKYYMNSVPGGISCIINELLNQHDLSLDLSSTVSIGQMVWGRRKWKHNICEDWWGRFHQDAPNANNTGCHRNDKL